MKTAEERPDLRQLELGLFSPKADEEQLRRLWIRGKEAWRDVDSAAAWVEELRGNTEESL